MSEAALHPGASTSAPAEKNTPGKPARRPPGWLKRVLIRVVLPWTAWATLRVLRATWRIREHGREHWERATQHADRAPVIAFLHGRAFMLLDTIRGRRNGRWLSMCSKSLDGDAMARLEEKLGYEVVRGSSGRDGLQAIVDMIRRVRETPGMGSALAVDGSRGPRGRVQGGIISLAQRTGGVILPVTVSASRGWIFRRAWDRTLLAAPFARVEVVFGEPFNIPPRLKADEFERLRAGLEERFVALQAHADELSGFGDDAPLRAPLN